MLNCCVNEGNVLEGRLASAHDPWTELLERASPSHKLRLHSKFAVVDLLRPAVPNTTIILSGLICLIVRAGDPLTFFQKRVPLKLISFSSQVAFISLTREHLHHLNVPVSHKQTLHLSPPLATNAALSPSRRRSGPKVENAFRGRGGPNQCGDGNKEIVRHLGTKREEMTDEWWWDCYTEIHSWPDGHREIAGADCWRALATETSIRRWHRDWSGAASASCPRPAAHVEHNLG